jgi:hypothetical protein
MCLSNSINGMFLTGMSYNTTSQTCSVLYMDNTVNPLMQIGKSDFTGLTNLGINSTTNIAWIITTIGNSQFLSTFPAYGITTTSVETRAQNPIGIDIADTIYRIAYYGPGYAKLDQVASASVGPENFTSKEDQDYYELGLIGIPGVNEKYDIRRFQS